MREAIHNEKWPVEEKEQLVGYGSALFTMPSGVARPRRPPRTPHTARFSSTQIKRGKGCRWPQASDLVPGLWCLSFSAKGQFCAANKALNFAAKISSLQILIFLFFFYFFLQWQVSIQTKSLCLICIINKQMHPRAWKEFIGGPAAFI